MTERQAKADQAELAKHAPSAHVSAARVSGAAVTLTTAAGRPSSVIATARPSPCGFCVLDPPGRSLVKYVFIQDEPFYLPTVLDKYLREYAGSTAGIVVQPVTQGSRTVLQTALALLRVYGPRYFQWKLRRYLAKRVAALIVNDLFGARRRCHSVCAVARKYGVPVHAVDDVNDVEFLQLLGKLGVELVVSISGTQIYRKALRAQIPFGIVNCHGGLLPKYRGLMPSFWTLANGERQGGVSVHYVDGKLDNGPIVVQKKYSIHPRDTLEDIMARGKDLAAEAILDCVRLVESGKAELMPNPAAEMSHYSMPTSDDVRRFKANGHRFF